MVIMLGRRLLALRVCSAGFRLECLEWSLINIKLSVDDIPTYLSDGLLL